MITKPTVLILGAGASQPFKFPSGRDLVKLICRNLASLEHTKTLNELHYSSALVEEFKKALLFSGKSSVDAFLEHRKEFIPIGKAAIAQALIPFEHQNHLYHLFDSENKGDNWYEYLFNKLDSPPEQFVENKLSILTFNYDRSLEHFLFTSIQNSYNLSEKECVNIFDQIPIIHLHGQLGDLLWRDPQGRDYIPRAQSIDIEKASKGIKIISEDIAGDREFALAHELLKHAQVIYFLGFGYNDINLGRLDVPGGGSRVIKGTGYGLGSAEIKDMKDKWANLPLDIQPVDVMKFLKEFGSLR